MSIHFNPETRPQFPQTLIYDEGVMDKADPFYKFHAKVDGRFNHKSREEVLARNATGPAWWFENGELHHGHTVGSWDCKPVTKETQPVYAGGINWGNAYFVSEADARQWASENTHDRYDIRHEDLGDVWVVHYHY